MERKEEDPEVLRLVVRFLRETARMSQVRLSTAARLAQSQLSQIELGKATPSEDVLRRLAAATDVPWPFVAHLRQFYAALLKAKSRKVGLDEKCAVLPGWEDSLAVLAYLLEDEAQGVSEEAQEAEAQQLWQGIAGLPRERRHRAIELSPGASRNPALARQLRIESEKAAAADPAEAKNLAELAVWVSERAKRR